MRVDPAFAAIAIFLAAGVFMFVRWRSPRPDFPPLPTAPDEPLLLDAMKKARSSVSEFLELARARPETAVVKLHFTSNSNEVEHLWAELVEAPGPDGLQVRLVTPPVTHSGELDRLYTCKIEDIEDWQVRDADNKIRGGFTQRAMFAIARRDGVKLPKKLLEIEREYADG